MKKLFSLAAVLLCAVMLSTTAFAASTDPLAVYKKYQKNLAKITSVEMSVSTKTVIVSDFGVGLEPDDLLKKDHTMKMRMTSDNKLEMEIRTFDSYTGEISYTYFENSYMYQQVAGEKYKLRMDKEQALANTFADLDLNLTEEVFKNAKIEMLDNGMKITYKTRINDLPDRHAMASLKDSEDDEITFSSVTTTAIIGYDGMLKSGSDVVGMKISDGDVSVDFKIVQSFKVHSVNSVDSIKFPADLGSYQVI